MTAQRTWRCAKELRQRIAAIPGVADAHLQQEVERVLPSSRTSTARVPLSLGSTPAAIANNLNVSLSSSEQVSPNFWTDPASGRIPYYFAVQTPEYQVSTR